MLKKKRYEVLNEFYIYFQSYYSSVSLSSDAWQTSPVDIFWSGGEHVTEDSEVLDVV